MVAGGMEEIKKICQDRRGSKEKKDRHIFALHIVRTAVYKQYLRRIHVVVGISGFAALYFTKSFAFFQTLSPREGETGCFGKKIILILCFVLY